MEGKRYGIHRNLQSFSLADQQQFETIGQFWEEMAGLYGLENLQGLGYHWKEDTISYAIGLKNGCIEHSNIRIVLPDDGWETAKGHSKDLKQLYDEVYQSGVLQFEIETFYENGLCEIRYYRLSME